MYYLRAGSSKQNVTSSPQVQTYMTVVHNNTSDADYMNVTVNYCPYAPGLVFWLDGINKGSTNNAWTDLVGGHVFTKNNNSITSDKNSFIFTSDADGYLKNSDTINFNYLSSTIEITYKPTVANVISILYIAKTVGSISYGYFGNGRRVVIYPANPNAGANAANAEHVFASDLYNAAPHIVSINKDTGILDFSNNRTSTASNYWGGNSTVNTIGNRELNNASTKFVGHIYSIRIYNRLLSANEIRNNQKIDNARFCLGLEASNPDILYTPRGTGQQSKIDDKISETPIGGGVIGGEISRP